MPSRRLTPQQQQLVNRLRQLEWALDHEFVRLGGDVNHEVRNYRSRALTNDDRIPLLQRIDAVLDPVYGSTRPTVPRTSSLYRLIRQSADGTIDDVFRTEYARLQRMIQPVQPHLWEQLEAILSVGGTGPDDELATVYRMLNGSHRDRERIARSRRLDLQRRWVPKEKWNTKTGYRLSDRVWLQKGTVRKQIDDMIREAVRTGQDPIELAEHLEAYLNPDAQVKDVTLANGKVVRKNATSLPRGGSGSYPARRLAITEVQRINGAATLETARILPSASGVQWLLSNNHPEHDQCDENARNHSPGMDPGCYTVDEFPTFPNHPLDRCTVATVQVSRQQVIDDLVNRYSISDEDVA